MILLLSSILSVASPIDKQVVRPTFTVVARSDHQEVKVLLDGALVGESTTPTSGTFTLTVQNASLGLHTLDVESGSDVQDLSVTVQQGSTGDACTSGADCVGGECAETYCTQPCGESCPSDFTCDSITDSCVPGGGCSVGGDPSLLWLVVLFGVSSSRRRRR